MVETVGICFKHTSTLFVLFLSVPEEETKVPYWRFTVSMKSRSMFNYFYDILYVLMYV